MTNDEYERLYKASRNIFQGNFKLTKKLLRDGYIEATRRVADAVREANTALQSDVLNAVHRALKEGADSVSALTANLIPGMISNSYEPYAAIEKEYIKSAFDRAGVDLVDEWVDNIYIAVNQRLLLAQANRVVNGMTFSERIWATFDADGKPLGINGDYQYRIKSVIQSGFAQNRDVLDIAADLNVYAKDGKTKLIKRYGRLVRGSGEFRKRISKQVDWRAVRLARSELYASMQQAAVWDAEANPASNGLIDWFLTPGAQHNCVCPDIAADTPYKVGQVPAYPHSNCLCFLVPRTQSREEFVNNIVDWDKGGYQPDIEAFYNDLYLKAAA